MIVNIIDHRTNSHVWKLIDTVVEPTWHDNRVKNSDQIERKPGDASWSTDEYSNVSLKQALKWASEFPGSVTLYLYDLGSNSRRRVLESA